ncbi:MAG: hypothetical protein ACTSWQ_04930 [Candidatus Thorarchaeota archaeon]
MDNTTCSSSWLTLVGFIVYITKMDESILEDCPQLRNSGKNQLGFTMINPDCRNNQHILSFFQKIINGPENKARLSEVKGGLENLWRDLGQYL